MDRRLLNRIDLGPLVKGEPAGCVLLYSITGGGISLVVTSRENGDAEIFLTREEAKKIATAIIEASAK